MTTHPCILCGGSATFKGRPCPGASHNPDPVVAAEVAAAPPPIAILGLDPATDPPVDMTYAAPGASGPVVFVRVPAAVSAALTAPSETDAPQVDPTVLDAPTPPGSAMAAAAQPGPASPPPLPPAVPSRACCSVAARPDAADINRRLLDGVPYRKVWAEAAGRRLAPLSEAAVQRHKAHLANPALGVATAGTAAVGPKPAAQPVPAAVAQPEAEAMATTEATTGGDAAASHVQAPSMVSPSMVPVTPADPPPVKDSTPDLAAVDDANDAARCKPDADVADPLMQGGDPGGAQVVPTGRAREQKTGRVSSDPPAPVPMPVPIRNAQDEVAYRLEKVTIAVAQGLWRGISSVKLLTQQFGCSEDEVMRLHRLATARVAAARGGQAAQLEGSVAIIRRIRDEDLELSAKHSADAAECIRRSKTTRDYAEARSLAEAARAAGKLAFQHRQLALAAQSQMDKITILRPEGTRIDVRVSVQADPDFDAALQVISAVLDVFYPGATALVTEAIGLCDEGGVPAVEEWLANRAALTVVGESFPSETDVPVEAAAELPAGDPAPA